MASQGLVPLAPRAGLWTLTVSFHRIYSLGREHGRAKEVEYIKPTRAGGWYFWVVPNLGKYASSLTEYRLCCWDMILLLICNKK